MILAEAQLQTYAQNLYDQDNDIPDSASEDYIVRRSMLNMGIGFWESYKDTEWIPLFTTLADSSTGGETTVATGDAQSDCPTALVKIGPYVRLTSGTTVIRYERKTPQEAAELVAHGSTDKFFWISGKPNAYKINWNPVIPSEYNGYTIAYQYYKKATLFTATTDVSDAPDHMFLVHYLLNWLYKNDDPGKSREQLDIADNLVRSLKRVNDVSLMDMRQDDFGKGFGL